MTTADDYFNTPPENREQIQTPEELIEQAEMKADFLEGVIEEEKLNEIRAEQTEAMIWI